MRFMMFAQPGEKPELRDDLDRDRLLTLLDDTATDHAMISNDLALVVGENSLLRPGRAFLEIDALLPGSSPELVRAPAALVRVGANLDLCDLGDGAESVEMIEAHLATGARWLWPVKIEGRIYLQTADGSDVRRHPALAYAVFEEADFVEQVTKNP